MAKRVKFIAKNNVERQVYFIDPDTNEEHITERESYGQNRYDEEMKSAIDDIDKWTNIDMKAYRADKLKEAVAKKAELDEIKELLSE